MLTRLWRLAVGLALLATVSSGGTLSGTASASLGHRSGGTAAGRTPSSAGETPCKPKAVPFVGGTTFGAIDSAGPNALWSGGRWFVDGAWTPSMMLWNGNDWELGPTPGTGDEFDTIRGIAAISRDDVWAVGTRHTAHGFGPLAIHWNGTKWSSVPVPAPQSVYTVLNAVSAAGPADVWAAGFATGGGPMRSLVEHWNGTAWKVVASPNSGATDDNILQGISAHPGGDVWAVGEAGPRALVMHHAPAGWKVMPVSVKGEPSGVVLSAELRDVAAFSKDNVWAVGTVQDGNPLNDFFEAVVLHWNGTTWSQPDQKFLQSSAEELNGIDGRSGSDLWVVGGTPGTGAGVAILHFDGATWTRAFAQAAASAQGVTEVAPGDVWLVGPDYTEHTCLTSSGAVALPGSSAAQPVASRARPLTADECAGGALVAARLPQVVLPGRCSLVGRVVADHGARVAVPPPGREVTAVLDTTKGSEVLSVATSPSGEVSLRSVGDESASSVPDETTRNLCRRDCLPACLDTAWTVLSPGTWPGSVKWLMNPARTPSPLTQAEALAAVKRAAAAISGSGNDCGLKDDVGLGTPFQGTTKKAASISSDGACEAEDGLNVVDFGQLPSFGGVTLGLTCVAGRGSRIEEADIRFQTKSVRWTLSPDSPSCHPDAIPVQIDFQSVATHEWGHAAGLGHVNLSPELTMYPEATECDPGPRTLGLGEVLGLRTLY